jgi:hypothetical protein
LLCPNPIICLRCKKGYINKGVSCQKIMRVKQDKEQTTFLSQESSFMNQNQSQMDVVLDANCVKHNASSLECISCDSGYYLESNFTCEKCTENCQMCRNKSLCFRCDDNYMLKLSPKANGTVCVLSEVSFNKLLTK